MTKLEPSADAASVGHTGSRAGWSKDRPGASKASTWLPPSDPRSPDFMGIADPACLKDMVKACDYEDGSPAKKLKTAPDGSDDESSSESSSELDLSERGDVISLFGMFYKEPDLKACDVTMKTFDKIVGFFFDTVSKEKKRSQALPEAIREKLPTNLKNQHERRKWLEAWNKKRGQQFLPAKDKSKIVHDCMAKHLKK